MMGAGDVVPDPDIHQAAFYGDIRELQLAIESGQDPKSKDFTGRSSFHIAAANGHVVFLEHLLEKGYDINDTDDNGGTALHLAAGNGHINVMKVLVNKGGDVKITTKKGRNVLGAAMCQADRDKQRIIIEFIKKCEREKMSWELD